MEMEESKGFLRADEQNDKQFKIIDAGRVIYRKGDFELLVIFNSSGPVDLKIRSHRVCEYVWGCLVSFLQKLESCLLLNNLSW